jgi:hypothetical protein
MLVATDLATYLLVQMITKQLVSFILLCLGYVLQWYIKDNIMTDKLLLLTAHSQHINMF